MGTLYLIPTPIGNLQDITLRALKQLQAVHTVLVEDTRTSGKLLSHFEITSRMVAYHEHNKEQKLLSILNMLNKHDVGLITDAGSPGISDPGFELVKACLDRDVKVVALPGPTAIIPALTASGLPTNSFVFLGFLGKKSSQRINVLSQWQEVKPTLILYESPYRLADLLVNARQVLGNRQACIARELTKKFESYYRGSLDELIVFTQENKLAGEMVVMIHGKEKDETEWTKETVKNALDSEIALGQSLSSAAKAVAQMSGWKKKQVYELGLS